MRIGLDGRAAKWYRGTGIGNYTYQLISAINSIDNCNDYLLFAPEDSDLDINFSKHFTVRNITENNTDNFWDSINIPNILLNNEVEIYHIPQNGIGMPNSKECPFIITLHDIIPYRLPDTVGKSYLKIFLEQMPDIIERCDGIITVSEYSKNDIIEEFNFPRDKIFVTYLAAESIYKPIDKNKSRDIIKHLYGIDYPFILYVGGFSPRKNIVGLIEAFSKFSVKNSEFKLVIAGKKGISHTLYKEKAEALGIEDKVVFPGFISMEHLPYLYNASDLFVYPSFYEGFGLPPIEAMSCGVPVVTSNTTSIPEIVGDNAFLINPSDIDQLSSALDVMINDEIIRKDFISRGIKRAGELSWYNTAVQTLSAYKSITN
ncbi:glycosyltransferase family 4 protein [Clostridium oryzae]|uniref:Mannosylfructose-phosphate synthase n=1 Tax=Clostridium oryzae TaxID=1450648 RepID=A0A1V4ITM1_9CLOT|nr:glycosyltransferase family 1 protein [Clostridium oryzae]OPJ63381.1 mannosylfructose-phosphate synthase [Clostridium oryzae]